MRLNFWLYTVTLPLFDLMTIIVEENPASCLCALRYFDGIHPGMSIFHEPGNITNLPRKNNYDTTREKNLHACPC